MGFGTVVCRSFLYVRILYRIYYRQIKGGMKMCGSKKAAALRSRILLGQTAVCLLILAGVLFARTWAPEVFEWLRRGYYNAFAHRQNEQEPARFAQADGLFWAAEAAGKVPEDAVTELLRPAQAFQAPVKDYTVSSGYGKRRHPVTGEKNSFHNGVDLACAEGTPVSAAMEGMVHAAGSDVYNGNYLILLHPKGVLTHYCHLQYSFVRQGEFVGCGQRIGTAGQTGRVTGPHLHFSVSREGIWYDPSAFLA